MSSIGGAGGSNGPGLLQGRSSLRGSLAINGESTPLIGSTPAGASSLTKITFTRSETPSQDRAAKFLSLSSAKRAADVAADGIKEISSLRGEQTSLVAEIAESPYGERSAELSTRITEIQSEITRVAEGATYNGVNVLSQGTTLNLESGTAGVSDAISLPNAQSIISVNLPAITSQEGAIDAYDDYLNVAQSAQGIARIVEGAQQKAGEVLESAVISAKADLTAPTDLNEAVETAQRIVAEITSQYGTEDTRQQLIEATIGALSSSKAQELLT